MVRAGREVPAAIVAPQPPRLLRGRRRRGSRAAAARGRRRRLGLHWKCPPRPSVSSTKVRSALLVPHERAPALRRRRDRLRAHGDADDVRGGAGPGCDARARVLPAASSTVDADHARITRGEERDVVDARWPDAPSPSTRGSPERDDGPRRRRRLVLVSPERRRRPRVLDVQ